MRSEPHKIKTVRYINFLSLEERKRELKKALFNTFNIPSDKVTFDMTSQGSSAMSQDQLSGILIGDEAYAGSRNFEYLENVVKKYFDHNHVCPTHNIKGSLKLISTTMVKEGNNIYSNSAKPKDLTEERRATLTKIVDKNQTAFSGNIDLSVLSAELSNKKNVPYVFIELFSDGYLPVSIENLKEARKIVDKHNIPLIVDISRIIANAIYIKNNEKNYKDMEIPQLVKEIIKCSHIVILDAAQDPRCNVGGLISTNDQKYFELYMNEVVVYEGLHTYGGMAGRTMEIFARGIEEMININHALWIEEQVNRFSGHLNNIPHFKGSDGIYIKADEFLPHIKNHQAQVLANSLYLKCGVRTFVCGKFGEEKILRVQIPRLSLTNLQLYQISNAINELYKEKDKIKSAKLTNNPVWHDESEFEWEIPEIKEYKFECTPYVIHTIEHIGVTTRKEREELIKKAGYNTFLLPSKAVAIDLLTDSGTCAMSVDQWEKYNRGVETPASSKDYFEFIETVQETIGYKYVIPTHQGRAAEHIVSQTLIKEGGFVPGNMYFTTTRLHQELAGGTFSDIIVDEAHIPTNKFEWKGNIDLNKLDKLVKEHGAKKIPYVSYQMSVNMAGGQPFSIDNVREVHEYCKKNGIFLVFDATRVAENAYMIQKKDPRFHKTPVKDILKELFSYGDGCTMSSKKDCLVNIGGFCAFKDNETLYKKALNMLRIYEGSRTNGGMSAGDMATQAQGIREMVSDDYIKSRVEQTQYLGMKLLEAGIPIVEPPGTHAIFLDVKRFLPNIDQDFYPAQALAAAIFVESGVRSMERGNVSKGRDHKTGKNFRPALELVRLTIPRRAYTNDHMDSIVDGIKIVFDKRDKIKGLKFVYEPSVLRFFQGRFEEV